jgi:restriction endonuclease Mrr
MTKGWKPMQKLKDKQESWLELCFRADLQRADVLPRDERIARPLKQLMADGLVKRSSRGNVRITKLGKERVMAKIKKELLK